MSIFPGRQSIPSIRKRSSVTMSISCAVSCSLQIYGPTHNCTGRPLSHCVPVQSHSSGGVWKTNGRHSGHADGLPMRLGRIRGNLVFFIFGVRCRPDSYASKVNKSFRLPSECLCLVVPTRGRIRPGLSHLGIIRAHVRDPFDHTHLLSRSSRLTNCRYKTDSPGLQ